MCNLCVMCVCVLFVMFVFVGVMVLLFARNCYVFAYKIGVVCVHCGVFVNCCKRLRCLVTYV